MEVQKESKTKLQAGIDIGSTTMKCVVMDASNHILYQTYIRHHSDLKPALKSILLEVQEQLGDLPACWAITGSGALSMSGLIGMEFVQEVSAVAKAVQFYAPKTNAAIELGGEDAKIIYFEQTLDERMNGVCAGGTGAFIDQMASLLQTDAAGLSDLALKAKQIYPIAARCGVFAKSDIQPLINDGASREDLAASIFQAVVEQTISGLACGKPIQGHIAFLGGPLHFLPALRQAFVKTLKLKEDEVYAPSHSHLFAAIGSSLLAAQTVFTPSEILAKLETVDAVMMQRKCLPPLFQNDEEYAAFQARHAKSKVARKEISQASGPCYVGIDAGSTTTKVVLLSVQGEVLYSFYGNNQGDPLSTVKDALLKMYEQLPESAWIASSCTTGYGESLCKTAFSADMGEVETVAHSVAAARFLPGVESVLDIGGQDMKFIQLEDGIVKNVLLNEACSSGCGSFIENFAQSLAYTAPEFAQEALFARYPCDLGTRCTVFMNSNVRQAQKEGASVGDIAAGLAYSVIKNALFKVIKLADTSQLGEKIVVQGGTFCNEAVLRAFELISGREVVRPDLAGLMGAYGAALLAMENKPEKSSLLSYEALQALTYRSFVSRCQGCSNHCRLSITKFDNGQMHVSGNRCENGAGKQKKKEYIPNLYAWKAKRLFCYEPLHNAPRGKIGIPRVLNIYENMPFWSVFFKELGFEVVLSPFSNHDIFVKGMDSIPSQTACYPAKISHGHIQWLIEQGLDTIFHPCIFYEKKENPKAQNHFNCPIVISYAENIKNNVEEVVDGEIRFLRPFISFATEKTAASRLADYFQEEFDIEPSLTMKAVSLAWKEQELYKQQLRQEGQKALDWMEENHRQGIVLAGRPYHIDPEIHHGIPDMIASYGLAVLSEDSLPVNVEKAKKVRVNDQWVFHSRLYQAAGFTVSRSDLQLVELTSFGCGLDAVSTDQVEEILREGQKIYTNIKIDETSNLGAARIRIRSLLAAMKRSSQQEAVEMKDYERQQFTRDMYLDGYTILCPQMSPIHFDLLEVVFRKYGYNIEVLDNDSQSAIDVGLQFVNNDACFPSITVVGQIMSALLSGEYDLDHTAILMSQTGGCCRASNYIALIRKALTKAHMSQIPVISINMNGMETNSGFSLKPKLLLEVGKALVYGDLLMRCLYRVRPYEKEPGSANALYQYWSRAAVDSLIHTSGPWAYRNLCAQIVEAFDKFEIDETLRKPRVGIVGEILVKYMPLANNHLVDLLEEEGAEVVVPDLMDFLNYCLYNQDYKHKYLGQSGLFSFLGKAGVDAIQAFRKPALQALEKSKRFEAPMSIKEVAKLTKPFLSLGNQYGEGWFLTGEMAELIHSGVENIVCIQPFACLPNHVVGKGTIKKLKMEYPHANIAALDYDASASSTNQHNRIKLLLANAQSISEQIS